MSSIKYIALGLVTTAVALTAFINKKHTTGNVSDTNKGFAVVELFTSEGCSSCPPAEALAAKIEGETADKPVYILEYHVTYWDKGGWKDSFSSEVYTNRQKKYATWLGTQLYTPQAVVNGTTELVGSDEGKMQSAIKDNLDFGATSRVTLADVKVNGNKVSLEFKTTGKTDNSTLMLAVVQKSAQTDVKAGENKGRTLPHVQIVRTLKETKVKSSGNAIVDLPTGFDTHGGELVAFIQNNSTGLITGATKAAL